MSTTHCPASEAEAAGIIRDACQARRPLAIEGGGTRTGIGRPVQASATLTSRALTGIVEYNPAEMVITLAAGTPLDEVEQALAQSLRCLKVIPNCRGAQIQ